MQVVRRLRVELSHTKLPIYFFFLLKANGKKPKVWGLPNGGTQTILAVGGTIDTFLPKTGGEGTNTTYEQA